MFLKKGIPVSKSEKKLSIEYSDNILGRVFDSYGNLIDGTVIEVPHQREVYDRNVSLSEIDIKSNISLPCK